MIKLLGFLTFLSIPLKIFNILGFIIVGVWLIILKKWALLLYGIFGSFISAYILILPLAPSYIFNFIGIFFAKQKGIIKYLFFLFTIIGILWIYIIMTLWGIYIFDIIMNQSNKSNWIPLLIWSYMIATAPWTFMASKDPDNFNGILTAFFYDLGYFLLMFTATFISSNKYILALVLFSILLLSIPIRIIFEIENFKKTKITS